MRSIVTLVLLAAIGWLLYDGEAYLHDLHEEVSVYGPWDKRIAFSYREFRIHDFSVAYSELPSMGRARSAGTWLFASLAAAGLALALSFVPRLRVLRIAGYVAAVLSVGVYAIWMRGVDWQRFAMVLQVRGDHRLSLASWLVVGLAVTGLAAPLLRGAKRPSVRVPRIQGGLPLRASGALALGALVWLGATDAMWRFEFGDRSGPSGTDFGSIDIGLRRVRDEAGSVGFKTKEHDLAYGEIDLPRNAPKSVRSMMATARLTSTIAFWTALLGGLALLAAALDPQRWIVQCVAGVAILAALLFAKFQLDAEVQLDRFRTPPDYGLTWAALAAACTGGLAAAAAFVSRRSPDR